jgi:hypothetical protein
MGQLRQTHCPVGAKPGITIRGLMLPTLIAGFATASVLTFAVASELGRLIRTFYSAPSLVLVVALAAFAVIDLSFPRLRPTIFNRQTPRSLAGRLPAPLVGLLWGLDTGSVISTFRTSAASWAALVLTVGGWGPWWVGGCYAAAFCIPLATLVVTFPVTATSVEGWRTRATETLVPALAARTTAVRWIAAAFSAAGAFIGLKGFI